MHVYTHGLSSAGSYTTISGDVPDWLARFMNNNGKQKKLEAKGAQVRFGTASPISTRLSDPVVQVGSSYWEEVTCLQFVFDSPALVQSGSNNGEPGESATSSPIVASAPSPTESKKSFSELFSSSNQSSRPISPLHRTATLRSPASSSPLPLVSPPPPPPLSKTNEEMVNDDLTSDLPEIFLSWRSLQSRRRIKILQGLLYCDPLGNILGTLQDRLPFLTTENAPFLKALAEIFHRADAAADEDNDQSNVQTTIIPEALYERIRERVNNQMFQGAQEDAQEFLTFIIDQLHEELLKNHKILRWRLSPLRETRHESDSSLSGEWMQASKKGVILGRTMELVHSPISYLFFGRFRSLVRRARQKDSFTTEPFHCLSLDIQDDTIVSLETAIKAMSRTEHIEGGITKTLYIESAPPILIAHLKRFYYHPLHGVTKISKYISYPASLALDPAVLYTRHPHQRDYRLFAVIYHHGCTADGGHYTCHVQSTSSHGWIFFDDADVVTNQTLERVLADKAASQNAYLLFYIRHTLHNPESNLD